MQHFGPQHHIIKYLYGSLYLLYIWLFCVLIFSINKFLLLLTKAKDKKITLYCSGVLRCSSAWYLAHFVILFWSAMGNFFIVKDKGIMVIWRYGYRQYKRCTQYTAPKSKASYPLQWPKSTTWKEKIKLFISYESKWTPCFASLYICEKEMFMLYLKQTNK